MNPLPPPLPPAHASRVFASDGSPSPGTAIQMHVDILGKEVSEDLRGLHLWERKTI